MLRLALAFVVVVLASAPAAEAFTVPAPPRTVEQSLAIASEAFPASPCAGRLSIVWDNTIHTRRPGRAGEAIGRQWVDGRWQTVDCRMALDPDVTDPETVCDEVVHEAGHLSGIDAHVPGTIMGGESEEMTLWPACHPLRTVTRREVAVADIREQLPSPRRLWRVSCNRKVTRCVARAPRARYARYFNIARDDNVTVDFDCIRRVRH